MAGINHDLILQCGDCGAHFQTTPGGSIDSAACENCGGTRFYRNQPNPTQSDGALRDMVDPITQQDMGGNPLGEGTIVGRDGEQSMKADTHGRDNFMHAHVVSHVSDPRLIPEIAHHRAMTPDGGMTVHTQTGHEHAAEDGGYAVAYPSDNVPIHASQLTPDHIRDFLHRNQSQLSMPDNHFGIWHDPKDSNVYMDISQILQDPNEAMQVGTDRNQEAIWDFANGQSIPTPAATPVTSNLSAQLSHRVMSRPETLNMEPYAPLFSEEMMHEAAHEAGLFGDIWNGVKDVGQGVYDAGKAVATNPIVDDAALGLGEGALALGTGGAAIPEELAGDAALAGGAGAAEAAGAAGAGAADAAGAGAGAGADSTANAAPSLMNRVMQAPGAAKGFAQNALTPANMAKGVGIEGGEQMAKDVMGGGSSNVPAGGSGYAMPQQAMGLQQLGSVDIPALLMLADLDTGNSVKSVDEGHDDPEKQDQKEFNDGDKSPSNLENPNNEDSGASGEDGVRDATPGYGFGPDSPGIQRLQSLMPLLMHYITNGISGADDPLVQGLHQALDQEQPGYLQNEHPDGPKIVEMMINDHKSKPKTGRLSLGHGQGPVTDEQKEAIKQLVDARPELFGDILHKVQNQPNTAPLVDPSQNPPAPAPMPPSPQGAMPVADPSQPGGGMAQPMQPMSSYRVADANSAVQRCPKCNSASTTISGLGDNTGDSSAGFGRCHSCGNVFDLKLSHTSGHRLVALGQPLPAADQQAQPGMGGPTGGVWKDEQGNDLQQGQIYSLKSPQYPVPDEVQIVSMKPHELGVKLVGDFANIQSGDPNTPDFRLTPQDLTTQKYTFEPSQQPSADQQAQQAPPTGGMPGMAQVPEQGPTTDQMTDSYPNRGTMSSYEAAYVDADTCPRCKNDWVEHTASTSTRTAHECVKCGHFWETEDEDFGREASVDLSWVLGSSGPDGMDDFRTYKDDMIDGGRFGDYTGQQGRNLSNIASRDSRQQAIKDLLDSRAQERSERTAGRHFSPNEQRDLINERGIARNSDRLDLGGTHYELRSDYTGKANGENVPDAHTFLGL